LFPSIIGSEESLLWFKFLKIKGLKKNKEKKKKRKEKKKQTNL